MFLAAAVQMASGPDREANLARAEAFIRRAAERGAKLVVLPEVFAWRGPRSQESSVAEPVPGPTSDRLGRLAAELEIHLQAGSISERIPNESRSYNTALLFSPRGEIVAHYRKVHLFDVEIPGQVTARESESRMPGSEVVTAETDLGRIGLSICYDLRFPELYRRLSVAGAEIICIPSAFTLPTGAAHWEVLVRARAIENQAWVIAPDQCGTSPNGHRDYGSSMIVDPWGTVVSRASEAEGVIFATIDRELLTRMRRELPCLTHRRL